MKLPFSGHLQRAELTVGHLSTGLYGGQQSQDRNILDNMRLTAMVF